MDQISTAADTICTRQGNLSAKNHSRQQSQEEPNQTVQAPQIPQTCCLDLLTRESCVIDEIVKLFEKSFAAEVSIHRGP